MFLCSGDFIGGQTIVTTLLFQMSSVCIFLSGNINQSLMTLRTCMEVLRENQMYGTNKVSNSLSSFVELSLCAFLCLTYLGLNVFTDGSIPRFKVNPSVQELL